VHIPEPGESLKGATNWRKQRSHQLAPFVRQFAKIRVSECYEDVSPNKSAGDPILGAVRSYSFQDAVGETAGEMIFSANSL
jgi:hypothetical protein